MVLWRRKEQPPTSFRLLEVLLRLPRRQSAALIFEAHARVPAPVWGAASQCSPLPAQDTQGESSRLGSGLGLRVRIWGGSTPKQD